MSETPQPPLPPKDTDPQRPVAATASQLGERGESALRTGFLPPYRVLLHNAERADMLDVIEALVDLTPLDVQRATSVMLEAHTAGVALVLVTHQERAELYVDQFQAKEMRVTIEPAV